MIALAVTQGPGGRHDTLIMSFGTSVAVADGRSAMFGYAAMKCASLLREAMWSMVSEIHSELDFDYVAYTDEDLERFRRVYETFKWI